LANGGRVLATAVGGAVQQRAGAVITQREDVLRARFEGDFADPAEVGGAADDDGWLGVADKIFDLSGKKT
jgi:hypothetical protein